MVMEATRLVHIRLDAELVKKIDHATVDLDVWRQVLVSALLRAALEQVDRGEWTFSELAEQETMREKEPVEA